MQLTQRERLFVGIGVVFIVALAVYGGVRFLKNQFNIDKELQAALSERQQIETLGNRYRILLNQKSPQGQQSGPTIDRYIEDLVTSLGLVEQVTIRPTETVVKKIRKRTISMAFRKTEAKPVLDLINRIEQEKGDVYKIESYASRPTGKTPGYYIFNLKVSSYEKAAN